MTSHGYVTEVT